MNPFVLADQLRETLLDYLRTTFHLADSQFEQQLFDFLDSPEGMFQGPFVDVRLPFRKALPGYSIPLEIKPPFLPHAHQVRAFERLFSSRGHQPQHTLVVTGTGSGKTECFLYPILDHCYRHRHQPGIKAILLYPMNALASDQARRLAGILHEDPRLRDVVTAGLYVGGKGDRKVADATHLVDDRSVLRESPPHILLTNYKMLDFLMLRPDDRKLWRHNAHDTLRYLVLDELHTYDGAQGSDVACLIRRLKARLGTSAGTLCAVGTSATVGAGASQNNKLIEFAKDVFGEFFTTDSVVSEDRQELDEVIPFTQDPGESLPPLQTWPLSNSAEEYLRSAEEMWFGRSGHAPLELGKLLEQHWFTRKLLMSLAGRLPTLPELAIQLARFHPEFAQLEPPSQTLLLQTFLTLISAARREVEGQTQPFLTCQTQFWVRELRHLTYHLGLSQFSWSEGRTVEPEPLFPPVCCRDCGGHFLLTIQREADPQLFTELSRIGQAFVERRPTCRVFLPVEEPGEEPTFLSLADMKISSHPGDGKLAIEIFRESSEGEKPRFQARCPQCDSDDSLIYLASRAATLTSVLTSNLFGSDYNQDKKLLAFTDSVQDASHLAGFLASRTYRFSLRSAVQAVVQAASRPISLESLPGEVWSHWQKQKGLLSALVTLWPPDLKDLPEFKDFLEKPGASLPKKLEEGFHRRLAWEIYSEYGFSAGFGRTLERTGCSAAAPDPERLHQAQLLLHQDILQRQLVQLPNGVTPEQIGHFLQGMLHRLRLRGAVHHPFLRPYVQRGAKDFYELTKRRQPWMAPLSSARLPRFLLSGAHANFDHFGGPINRLNWYRDWAHRVFGCDRKDDGLFDLYRWATKRLVECGILGVLPAAGLEAYGLQAESLEVDHQVGELQCSACGHTVHVGERHLQGWSGQRCLHFRCSGSYAETALQPNFYSRIYRAGQAERVHPFEHTGLLQRQEREELEDAFKGGGAGSANLLVCTPTLEMGVDVGDLSAVMACSVPPATANYLQRMGRAGRKTGNALCLTMVESRPHDLYFFHAPLEMIRGQVLPPGCFLEAPEMLQRQLIAFAMDQWARQENSMQRLQPEIQFYLGKGRAEFPGKIQTFYRDQRETLITQFLELFEPKLSPVVQAEMQQFAASDEIPRRLEAAVQAVAEERDRYRKLLDRCKQRLDELAQVPAAMVTQEHLEEQQELEGSRRVLGRLITEVVRKYPLNVLTDAGVLPNYAFPEPGVSLRATVLYRDEQGQGRIEPQTHEYMRPASNALRELAPHNHFYAEGRKIRINEVSLGSKHQPLLEEWRVCPNCCFSSRADQPESTAKSCPACKHPAWSDRGQLLKMVRMQQVSALCDVLADRNTDASDDREIESYHTLDLISVGSENYAQQAYQIPSLPFGAELLRRLTLREVNFGVKGDGFQQIQVAGQPVPDRGFTLCFDCGRVLGPREDEIRHAPYCKHRKGNFKPNSGSIFLYRQITSEAIRLLLPAATLEVDEQLASFKAALMLGFRRKFQGNPLHLLIRRQSEPLDGPVRRNFLVIYDAVPGGTGYLSEMASQAGMQEILSLSRDALTSCSCRLDPQKDGCYRCLFAYQNQYELAFVSRRRALELLGHILENWDKREACVTLSEVRLDECLESELEALFLGRLKQAVEKEKGDWNEGVHGGTKVYYLKLNGRSWTLAPQVSLGFCRPDFLLTADKAPEGERRVAIFCDGLEFHVCPGQVESRLADDLEKRTRLLAEGRHWVLNVTWEDVSQESKSVEVLQQILDWMRGSAVEAHQPSWEGFLKSASAKVRQLLQASDWKLGSSTSLKQAQQQMVYGVAPHGYSVAREDKPNLFGANERRQFAHLGVWWSPQGKASLDVENVKVVLRLFDSIDDRQDPLFKESWRWFLRQWNQFQFLPNCLVTSTSLLDSKSPLVEMAAESIVSYLTNTPVTPKPDLLWTQLENEVHSSVLAALPALRQAGLQLPIAGYELEQEGRVQAEAELAWPARKTVLLLTPEPGEAAAWEGWQVFSLEQLPALIDYLKEQP